MNKKLYIFLCVTILLIASIIVLFPILRPGFLITDDGDWMIIRLSAFYQSFREGQFPVRFLGRLNQSYGYPVANFLYPGFMYIGSIIHFFGVPFQATVELIMISSVLIGVCFTFFWLRKIFSMGASLAGAIVYLLMPYLLFDIFKRGSVGEVLAIGLVPVAFYAIESKNKALLPPVIALIAISHNTLTLFFVPLLLGYIFLKKRLALLLHFIFGVGMTSFFWFPALFERVYVAFDVTTISDPITYFSISQTIILRSLPILIAVLVLVINNRYKKQNDFWFFSCVAGISLFFASQWSAFFWRTSDLPIFVQFPFRWLSLLVVVGPWFVACCINWMKKGRLIVFTCIVLLFIANWAMEYTKAVSVLQPEGYYTTNEATTTVKNEYMPTWASKQMKGRANKPMEFFKGRGTIDEIAVTTQRIDVVIHAVEESVIQINTIYYPGWGAMIDGEKAEILYKNEYGLMRIAVPVGDHSFYMEFRETPGRFLADLLSVIFGLLYVASYFVSRISLKKKKDKRRDKKSRDI